MIYHPVLNQPLMFGGQTSGNAGAVQYFDDLRAFSPLDLWPFAPGCGAASCRRPSGRAFHAMAYDVARGDVVLFGGTDAVGVKNDTWTWRDGNWAQVITGDSQPAPRSSHAMTYDARRGRVVLFGGETLAGAKYGDLWEWSGSRWRRFEFPPHARTPSPRSGHVMAYDSARARVVLQGGKAVAPEVWELHTALDQRPAFRFAFSWDQAQVDSGLVTGVRATAQVGGIGNGFSAGSTGAAIPGARLRLWNGQAGEWQAGNEHLSGLSAPAALTYRSQSTAEARAFVGAEARVHLMIDSAAGLGNGASAPEVAVDYSEIEIEYQLP